jgi:hypothetical protein
VLKERMTEMMRRRCEEESGRGSDEQEEWLKEN